MAQVIQRIQMARRALATQQDLFAHSFT